MQSTTYDNGHRRTGTVHPLVTVPLAIADFLAPVVDGIVRRAVAAAEGLAAAVRRYREKQRIYEELMDLDDRMLQDIGITRADIPAVVNGRFVRRG